MEHSTHFYDASNEMVFICVQTEQNRQLWCACCNIHVSGVQKQNKISKNLIHLIAQVIQAPGRMYVSQNLGPISYTRPINMALVQQVLASKGRCN